MTPIGNRIIIEESHHSSRGASSSHRWLACPGSIPLTEELSAAQMIHGGSSRAAAEGTAAHLVLSTSLEDGTDASDMAGMEIETGGWVFIVDGEMVEGVQECLDWVRRRVQKAKDEGYKVTLHTEQSLESFLDADVYGTADVIIHIHGDRLIVVDFKYGKGVVCEPDSSQNFYYGYLAVENFLSEEEQAMGFFFPVESWIAQPRIPHPDETIRSYETSAGDLTDWWTKTVLPGIEATRDKDAVLVIGDHCRFCPAKSHCPALKNETFEFPMGIDVSYLTDVELGGLLDKLEAIEVLKQPMQAEALRRARQGDQIPGRKLVRMRSNRIFHESRAIASLTDADEMIEITIDDAVRETFGMEGYSDPKLLSPAQIEKLDGGKDFASQWAHKPDRGLTLAAKSDKRKEVKSHIEAAYD